MNILRRVQKSLRLSDVEAMIRGAAPARKVALL